FRRKCQGPAATIAALRLVVTVAESTEVKAAIAGFRKGACQNETYASGSLLSVMDCRFFILWKTPTICHSIEPAGNIFCSGLLVTKRCVRGSTVGKKCCTNSSLTTTTGVLPAISVSFSKRPLSRRTPNVSKKLGVTL